MNSLQKYFDSNFDIYYSGSDVTVFIGNILVDEVTMIGWNKIDTSSPSFSYNKDIFTTVLHGKYHVEGKIAVNFVTPAYLEYIIMKSNLDPQKQLALTTYQKTGVNTILEMQQKKYKYYFYTYKNKQDTPPTDKIKNALRNYLWGHTSEKIDKKSVQSMIKNRYFNMIIIFGNPVSEDYAIRTIVDAKLIGDSTEIVADGTAVQLIYSFVARLEDAPITPKVREGYRPDISTKAYLHNVEEYIHDLGEKLIEQNVVGTIQDSTIYLPAKSKQFTSNHKVIFDDFPYWFSTIKNLKIRINVDPSTNYFDNDDLFSKLLSTDILFTTDSNNEEGYIDTSIKDIFATDNIDDNKLITIDNLKPLLINNIISVFQYLPDNDHIDIDVLANLPIDTFDSDNSKKFVNNNSRDDKTIIKSLTKLDNNKLILKKYKPINMKIPAYYNTEYGYGMRYCFVINDPEIISDYHNLQISYNNNSEYLSNVFYNDNVPFSMNKIIAIPDMKQRLGAVFQTDFDKFIRAIRSYIEILFKEVYYSDGLYLTGDNINDVGTKENKTMLGNLPDEKAPKIERPDLDDVMSIFFGVDDFIDAIDESITFNINVFPSPVDDILKLRKIYVNSNGILKDDYNTPVDRDDIIDSVVGYSNQLYAYELQRKNIDSSRNKLGNIENIDSYHLMQIDVKDTDIIDNAGINTKTTHAIHVEKKIGKEELTIKNIINKTDSIDGTESRKLLHFNYDDNNVYITFEIHPIFKSDDNDISHPNLFDYNPFYNSLFVKYGSNNNKYDMIRHNMLVASKSAVILNDMELNIKVKSKNASNEDVDDIDTDWITVHPKNIQTILQFNSPYGVNKLIGYNLHDIKKFMGDIKSFRDAILGEKGSYFVNSDKVKKIYIISLEENFMSRSGKYNSIYNFVSVLLGKKENDTVIEDKYYVGIDLVLPGKKENGFDKIKKAVDSLIDDLKHLKKRAKSELGSGNKDVTELNNIINNLSSKKNELEDKEKELINYYNLTLSEDNLTLSKNRIDIVGINNTVIDMLDNIFEIINNINNSVEELNDIINNIVNELLTNAASTQIVADETRSIAPVTLLTLQVPKDDIDDVEKIIEYADATINNKKLVLKKDPNINDILSGIWNAVTGAIETVINNITPRIMRDKGTLDPDGEVIDVKNIKDRIIGNYWVFKSNGKVKIDNNSIDVRGSIEDVVNANALRTYSKDTTTRRKIININNNIIKLSDQIQGLSVNDSIAIEHGGVDYVYVVKEVNDNTITIIDNERLSPKIKNGDYVYALDYLSNLQKEEVVVGDMLYFTGKEFKVEKAYSTLMKCVSALNSGKYCNYQAEREKIIERLKNNLYKLDIEEAKTKELDTTNYKVNMDFNLRFKNNHNKLVVYSLYNTKINNEIYVINSKNEGDKPDAEGDKPDTKIVHNILAQYKIDPMPTTTKNAVLLPIVSYDNNGKFHVIDISSLQNRLFTIDDIGIIDNLMDSDTTLDYNILYDANDNYTSLFKTNKLFGQIMYPYMMNNMLRQYSLYELENTVKKTAGLEITDYSYFNSQLNNSIYKLVDDEDTKKQLANDYSKQTSIIGVIHNGIDTVDSPSRMGGWFITYSLKYIDPEKEFTKAFTAVSNKNKNIGFGIYFTEEADAINDKWLHPSFHVVIDIEQAIKKLNDRFHIELDAGISKSRQRKKFKEGILDAISKIEDARIDISVEHTDGVLFTSDKLLDLKCKLNI